MGPSFEWSMQVSVNEVERASRASGIDLLSLHLDAFASKLDLLPVTRDNNFAKALKPVSHKAIEAVYTVCPQSNACQTRNCALRSIQQVTRKKDLPLVTLIKDFKFHTKYKPTADTITEQPGNLPPIVTRVDDDNAAPVKMVVVDGIVMGPKVRLLKL